MSLARLQRAGHTPIALVGGGTGLIGDPSGKSQERSLLTFEQVEANAQGIRAQLERFLDFDAGRRMPRGWRNNVDWLRPIGFLDFLRDVGKHFTVNYMMAKESVKRRLGGDEGISLHRVQLSAAAGVRLPRAARPLQLHAADGRQRSVGQHHGRLRSDSQGARRARARPGAAADDDMRPARSSARPKRARSGSIRR